MSRLSRDGMTALIDHFKIATSQKANCPIAETPKE